VVAKKNSKLFYIRTQRYAELSRQIRAVENWKNGTIMLL